MTSSASQVAGTIPSPESSKTQAKMRIAVLTSGGDSAGMNAVVRAVVKGAILK